MSVKAKMKEAVVRQPAGIDVYVVTTDCAKPHLADAQSGQCVGLVVSARMLQWGARLGDRWLPSVQAKSSPRRDG